jgi:cytochrome bd-type quinol oxidase subunit 1
MRQTGLRWSQWTVTLGAVLFLAVLAISAYWEADIRWLHFFQAWMYLATIALVLKGNRWGYFIGLGVAALWNYTTLFVNTFLKNGLEQVAILAHTRDLPRPDLFLAVPGWLGNLAVIVGCLWAYALLRDKEWKDAAKFAVAVAATTGFFALIVALFQPRYLPLFPRLLHPHLHL